MSNFAMAGYANLDLSTGVDKINGIAVRLANNVLPTAADLSELLPGFYVEADADGIYKLCIVRTLIAKYVITDANSIDHSALPFEPIFNASNELVGGRPPVNR